MRTITRTEEENSSLFSWFNARAEVAPFQKNVKEEFSFEAWRKYVLLSQSRFPFTNVVIKKIKAEGLTLQFLIDVEKNELNLSTLW